MNYKAVPEGIAVTKKSPLTKLENTMIFKVTLEKFQKSLKFWDAGRPVQKAFPYLDENEREFLLTGYTNEDWEAMFGPN